MRIGNEGCITVRRPLSGLAQTGPNPLVEYMTSLKRANAELDYLGAATASNWEERVNNSLRLIPNEFKTLETFVRNKTGNPEAERQLFELWGTVSKTAIQMNANKPGVFAQLKDKVSLFLTSFWKGAQEAQQGYASWAVESSGPILKMFHGGLQKLALLKRDLADAKAAGRPASEIAAQEQKIAGAEAWANRARSTFSAISAGASLDKLAIQKYGALSGPIAAAIIFGSIVMIFELVTHFIKTISDIKPLASTLTTAIQQVQAQITDAAKKAGAAVEGTKGKLETIIPIVGVSIVLAAAGAFYYFVIAKKHKVVR